MSGSESTPAAAPERPAPRRIEAGAILGAVIAKLEGELARFPQRPDIRRKLCVAKVMGKDPAGAKAVIQPAVEAHPSYVDAALALAFAHLALGEKDAAQAALETLAGAATPGYALSLALGLGYAAAKRFGKARSHLEAAVQAGPRHALPRYALAQVVAQLDPGAEGPILQDADADHFEISGAARDRQILGNPGRAVIFREMAFHASDHGDAQAAQAFLDLAVSLDLEMTLHEAARGEVAFARGEVAEALDRFRDALRHDAENVLARISLAHALRIAGDAEGAGAELTLAVVARPHWPDIRYELARYHMDKGEMAKAAEHLSAALERNPRYAAARFALGEAKMALGDAAGAVAALEGAESPHTPPEEVRALHAKALLALGRLDEAEARYKDAIEADDTLPSAHLGLALVAEKRGDRERAKAHLADHDARERDLSASEEAQALRARLR